MTDMTERVQETVAAPVWHPIATAPRDGTWFRARTAYGTERFVHFADAADRYPISGDGAVWSTSPTEWARTDTEVVKKMQTKLRNFAAGCRGSMWQNRSETLALCDSAADLLEALDARLAELEASRNLQQGFAIQNGKAAMQWVAELEAAAARAEAAEAEIARLRTAAGAAGVLLQLMDGGDEGPISAFLRALATGEPK